MAKSIKYKEADTFHDAGNVYDSIQAKTQDTINADVKKILDSIDGWEPLAISATVCKAWINKRLRIGFLQYNFEGSFPLAQGWVKLGSIPSEYKPLAYTPFTMMYGANGDKTAMCAIQISGDIQQYVPVAGSFQATRGSTFWIY